MKFKVNKKDFHQAIQSIIGVVPVKTTIPILGNLLLDLNENVLTMTGTDLEVSVSTKLDVKGESDGAVAIPAKVLFEIVRELPDIPMELESDDEYRISLRTEKGFYKLSGEPKDDFPRISIDDSKGEFDIEADLLESMINRTLFAVSTDELRTTLMGVYLNILEDELRMVATDGHRLVKIVNSGFKSPDFQQETIIPTKALNLLTRNLQGDSVHIRLSDDHIVFELGKTIIFSKSIEGQFPNYERVIPADNDKKVIVNRDSLSASVRRVAIFSNSITHQIRLSVSAGALRVQSEDIEFGGEAEESIDAQYKGDDLVVGYNANYLLDILRHVDSDEIELNLKDPVSAAVVHPTEQEENETLLMLLMPIRLNEE